MLNKNQQFYAIFIIGLVLVGDPRENVQTNMAIYPVVLRPAGATFCGMGLEVVIPYSGE